MDKLLLFIVIFFLFRSLFNTSFSILLPFWLAFFVSPVLVQWEHLHERRREKKTVRAGWFRELGT